MANIQVTPQVKKLISVLKGEMPRLEIQELLKLTDRENFRLNYLQPALEHCSYIDSSKFNAVYFV